MSDPFKSEDIQFPCTWHGSLIMLAGTEKVEESVRSIFADLGLKDHDITPGQVSRNGSYVTWRLASVVPDLPTLRELFRRLEALPGKRMLI